MVTLFFRGAQGAQIHEARQLGFASSVCAHLVRFRSQIKPPLLHLLLLVKESSLQNEELDEDLSVPHTLWKIKAL